MEDWEFGGITVNGRSLRDFSAKLQTAYRTGACSVSLDTFQGKNRSTVLLLNQTYAAMEIVLPLEIWGRSRQDAVEITLDAPICLDGRELARATARYTEQQMKWEDL